ncbi:UBX domain-containing protein 7 [Nakaseomyces glabratus]|uniref:UBX domain-containing protein 7 n=1 Tax=Candida glabrata TaxID=5478 RepID=A0A0W0CFG8_CANGB|nr:UBX domain profile [Nakaseomyces glabratus]KTA97270.1 UBX domain-containing protein 7 [Nakaseomyces glabratus]KTA98373.1 UBX domain-containing protein 7 [Nakaseomyces glabratus]KTB05980.1 UBX domain-containing protein 7 [Nakaseomyces glabratus]KTB11049.1 UBX domain-containing protein 7 [Nakaseomyces glabratus]
MDVESLLWLSIRDSRRIIVTVNDEPMGELADECQIVRLSRDSDSFQRFVSVFNSSKTALYYYIEGPTVVEARSLEELKARFPNKNSTRPYESERQRIIDLINADKLERNSRSRQLSGYTALSSKVVLKDNIKNNKSDICTLKIRMTNGDYVQYDFDSNTSLGSVRRWLKDYRTDGDFPYLFHQNISRKSIRITEEYKTLAELDLTPRSILMLKQYDLRPRTRVPKPRKRSWYWQFLTVRIKRQLLEGLSEILASHRTTSNIMRSSSMSYLQADDSNMTKITNSLPPNDDNSEDIVKIKQKYNQNTGSIMNTPLEIARPDSPSVLQINT